MQISRLIGTTESSLAARCATIVNYVVRVPGGHDERPVRFDQGMGMDGYGWVWNNWSMIAACRQIGKPGLPGAKEEASLRHRRPALRQYRILTGLVEVIERALAGDGA